MILVTGSTGLTGAELVRRLSARGAHVRALVRNKAKAAAIAGLPGVEIAIGDMARPETLMVPLRGVERAMLISSSDPAMLDVQSAFIAAAARAGVRHVVKLSGIIPGRESPFRFARMHFELEHKLEASGMAFTHIRPGQFMETYFRQVPSIVADGTLPLPMGRASTACIDTRDIAEVSARVLTTSGHEGKIYPITGPESLTMDQVAEKLSRAVGRPVRYIDVDPAAATQAALSGGVPPFLAEAVTELFAVRRQGAETLVYRTIQEVFGFQPVTFDEFANRHAAIFRGEQPAPKV